MFESEIVLGLIGFGESSIYPTYLDSPGGNAGMGPAVPLFGSRSRRLADGDLVFVDVGCGYRRVPHGQDHDVRLRPGPARRRPSRPTHGAWRSRTTVAALLTPGAVPSAIYETVTADLEPAFLENFMGYGGRCVQFLGHGIGLEIAENPVHRPGLRRAARGRDGDRSRAEEGDRGGRDGRHREHVRGRARRRAVHNGPPPRADARRIATAHSFLTGPGVGHRCHVSQQSFRYRV